MIYRLTINELVKIFGKWRSYIGFIALAVLLPLVIWGVSQGSGSMERQVSRTLGDNFIIVGSVFNGFLATYITMNFLWVHIPFLVALVAGDVVAGEGAAGTFRIYLTRSASRLQVIFAKLLATFLYTVLLIVFFGIMSLGVGTLWLGAGDMIIFEQGILVLPGNVAWLRFGLAFLFAIGMMLVVAALCFMLSSMVNNAIGPIIGGMAIIVIGLAISNIPIDFFSAIKPYIFTNYFDIWQLAFRDPIPWEKIATSLNVMGIYTGIFIITSFIIFIRKDILS